MMAIALSIEFNKYKVSNWGWILSAGIVGVIFSFILLLNPIIAGLTVAAFTGLALITIGIIHIYFSIELKSIKKHFQPVHE
jgi:uncharacterized membrane protein HdeD (DUF308 family)